MIKYFFKKQCSNYRFKQKIVSYLTFCKTNKVIQISILLKYSIVIKNKKIKGYLLNSLALFALC